MWRERPLEDNTVEQNKQLAWALKYLIESFCLEIGPYLYRNKKERTVEE